VEVSWLRGVDSAISQCDKVEFNDLADRELIKMIKDISSKTIFSKVEFNDLADRELIKMIKDISPKTIFSTPTYVIDPAIVIAYRCDVTKS